MADSRLQRNLRFLSGRQPELARSLATTIVPRSVVPVLGRDGTPTFRLTAPDGRLLWMGRSSTPTLTAEETIAAIGALDTSVFLLGVYTGCEPLILSRGLPAHAAVFILESSDLAIRLVLELYDYASELERGRIVFLHPDRLDVEISDLFNRFPGYEMPGRMVSLPHGDAIDLPRLQERIENLAAVVEGIHTSTIRAAVERLSRHPPTTPSARPRVAVITDDPRPEALDVVNRIGFGLSALPVPFQTCAPTRPDQYHLAARMQMIAGLPADLVLMVNSFPGRLRSLVPPWLPIASWFWPGAGLDRPDSGSGSPSLRYFTSSLTQGLRLEEAGLSPETVTLCSVGATPEAFKGTVGEALPIPLNDTRIDPNRLSVRVAEGPPPDDPSPRPEAVIIQDLPDPRPEAHGIVLPSHVALWRALGRRLRSEIDNYTPSRSDDAVRSVERELGMPLSDQRIRADLVRLVTAVIAPTQAAWVAAEVLTKLGTVVRTWGKNWVTSGLDAPGPFDSMLEHQVAAPGGETCPADATVVVLPWPDERQIIRILDYLALGKPVVARTPFVPWRETNPDLDPVGQWVYWYRRVDELRNHVNRLRQVSPEERERMEDARRHIVSGHLITHRLRSILNHMQSETAPPTTLVAAGGLGAKSCGPS